MKTRFLRHLRSFCVACWAIWTLGLQAWAQAPWISSFSQNGELACTNLAPGTIASVKWASVLTGPWTNNWAGLDSVVVDSNGMIRVSVPMFYRVVPAPANMSLIPAGSFTMGNCMDPNEGETNSHERNCELPLHSAYVSAFYMDRYEVTKALWDEVYLWATNHGYSFEKWNVNFVDLGHGKATNHPVQYVDWYDAVKWCNARSEKENRRLAYYMDADLSVPYRSGEDTAGWSPYVNWNSGYRLPTEAEWEKAARGGVDGHRFPWSDADTIDHSRANYDSQFNDGVRPYTSPVGYFAANGYGLYDMAGNVWEWCWDWLTLYPSGPQTDPRGPTGTYDSRVLRGGSWAGGCRVSCRGADTLPWYRRDGWGFRSVLPLGQSFR